MIEILVASLVCAYGFVCGVVAGSITGAISIYAIAQATLM